MPDAPSMPQSPHSPPHWLPPGVKLETVPKVLQDALKEILDPAYEELVLQAPDALSRTTGYTYLHLIWLELLEQYDLGKALFGRQLAGADHYQERMVQHLRLLAAKDKFGKFLLQLRTLLAKHGG